MRECWERESEGEDGNAPLAITVSRWRTGALVERLGRLKYFLWTRWTLLS